VTRRPCRDVGWSIPLRSLHREPGSGVRNQHWKDRPAKPHDAAAHADREDDRAPANIAPLHTKRLQRPLLDDVWTWEMCSATVASAYGSVLPQSCPSGRTARGASPVDRCVGFRDIRKHRVLLLSSRMRRRIAAMRGLIRSQAEYAFLLLQDAVRIRRW
jgi:hypothetical protein